MAKYSLPEPNASSVSVAFATLTASAIPMVVACLRRLDPESRFRRFGHAVSETFLEGYANRLSSDDVVMIGTFHACMLRGVAELHRLTPHCARDVEFAVAIDPGFQDKGIGKALSGKALETAEDFEADAFHVCFDAANHRMASIARRLNLTCQRDGGFVLGRRSLRLHAVSRSWPSQSRFPHAPGGAN